MKNKLHILLFLAVLHSGWVLGQENTTQSESEESAKPETPRFIDRDGDGFNDLLPDLDRDGVPDVFDPDFVRSDSMENGQGVRIRWAWFRAMPDSLWSDSTQFKQWWGSKKLQVDWEHAWDYLQRIQREHGVRGRPNWWDYDGFSPRRNPLLDDPRRPRKRRSSGGGR